MAFSIRLLTILRPSTSSPESSSSRIAICGLRATSCKVSILFFSPPDISELTPRAISIFSSPRRSASCEISSLMLEISDDDSFSRSSSVTPSISTGYCMAKKRPNCARCHVGLLVMSSPLSVMLPWVIS